MRRGREKEVSEILQIPEIAKPMSRKLIGDSLRRKSKEAEVVEGRISREDNQTPYKIDPRRK